MRLWGHAGSDVETSYLSLAEIESIEARDPVLANARLLVERGVATPEQLRSLLSDTRARVQAAAEEAAGRPKLTSREEVMAPLAPEDPERWQVAATGAVDSHVRLTTSITASTSWRMSCLPFFNSIIRIALPNGNARTSARVDAVLAGS